MKGYEVLNHRILAENIISFCLNNNCDFVELYFESRSDYNLHYTNSKINSNYMSFESGVGIKFCKDKIEYFISTNTLNEDHVFQQLKVYLKKDFINLSTILGLSEVNTKNKIKQNIHSSEVYQNKNFLKVKDLYSYMKNKSSNIKKIDLFHNNFIQEIEVYNSEGINASEIRKGSRFGIESLAQNEIDTELGIVSPAYTGDMNNELEIQLEYYANLSIKMALNKLKGEHIQKKTNIPIVLGRGSGGVLFHEACGHALEGNFLVNQSVFYNQKNKDIASPLITYIDDPTQVGKWGSILIDDEGNKTAEKTLIKNGKLNDFLLDKNSSIELGLKNNFSARRQSFRYPSAARMTNTYIKNGDSSFDQIISNTKHGIYAKTLGGGSVNPKDSEFNFTVIEGYIINNGKIEKPLKDFRIIGKGNEVLKNVDMVGNDCIFQPGLCNASSGKLNVTVGCPTLRINSMNIK
ncbi:TldD/PmbA family protein [Exiguobacterium undae]|uniref:TldD/PmbA family protein n=1 Tax=Exiguobacterium undae TaxID=169177 RepID=UPI0006868908|nr:TldD/PmbA family protein [Exiguobacterium undae]